MNTVDDRIAAALRARAGSVTEDDLTPAVPPSHRVVPLDRARTRWAVPLLAAAITGILAVATVTAVQLNRSTGHPAGPVPQPSVSLRPVPPSTVAPTIVAPAPSGTPTPVRSTPSQPPSSQPPSSVAPTPAQPFALGYEPLWPFTSYAEAEKWRTTVGGFGPWRWHLDAGETAMNFTANIGLTDITQVIAVRMNKLGAHVDVGYRDPNGQERIAATLHLVQFGTAKDSPWEVVGSDDTTLSLEQPAYGSRVTSPVTIGGHITGVDENIVVSLIRVIHPADIESKPLARVPAGGDHAAWTTGSVPFTGHGVLIILATTGGHVQQVERFAIQGVHT